MAVNSNPLECFLCWKPFNNIISQTLTNSAEVLQSKFEFSKQQTDNCKKYLKSEIINKCREQNIKIDRWECENFCSTCFETSETLTVFIEVLEETQRELNLIVNQFNEQILNERCKKLNLPLPANTDYDTDDLSDGFGDDFLNNEEEYDALNNFSTISNASGINVFDESHKQAFDPKSSKETDQLLSTQSRKRKIENETESKSTKKPTGTVPRIRIILEKMSDGVVEIMQEKLIERLISDGIIAEPPPIHKTKIVDFGRSETELGDENKLFVVKPVINDGKNEINDSVEIKQELDDFHNNSQCLLNDKEVKTIETPENESFACKTPTNVPLICSKDLRINLSRIKFTKGKTNPITPINTEVVKTTAKVKQKEIFKKDAQAQVKINSVQSENQNYILLESDTTPLNTILEERLDGAKIKGKLLEYKCESCEFLAASFEELFQHKKIHNPNQPLKCTKCSKEFNKEMSFFTHMRYHTVNSSNFLHQPPEKRINISKKCHKCNFCKNRFCSIYALNEHQKIKHQETVQFECKITGKIFWKDNRSFRWNINTRPFECNDCKLRFKTAKRLAFHQKKIQSDEPSKSVLFECKICGNIYSRADHLKTHHLNSHTGNKLNSSYSFPNTKQPHRVPRRNYVTCRLCCKKFKYFYDLEEHRKAEHRKTEHLGKNRKSSFQFECKISGKVFTVSRKSLCRNINSRPFKCEGCKLSFKTAERLAFHQRKQQDDKTSANTVLFECKYCGNIYNYEHTLQCHMRNHTGVKPFQCKDCGKCFTRGSLYKSHQKVHISTFDFICERENCGEKFKIVQDLNQHKRNHMKEDFLIDNDKGEYYQCPECDKTFKKLYSTEFVDHMLTHELKFVCSICESKFTTKLSLDDHHVEVHGNKYPCKLCSKTFKFKTGLTFHVKVTHMEPELHACEDCGASFKRQQSFNMHRKVKHPKEGDPSIKCHQCERMFFSREQMLIHKSSSHKQQQCEVCGLSVSTLSKHMLTHNTIPFECDICGKQFKRKELLDRHKKAIHEGHKQECKDCGRKFNGKSTLQLHMRTHTGEKPYECSVCAKRFDRKHNLTTHMRFHTGEKPYKCDKCGNQFSRKDNLNIHVKKCSS